MSTTKIIIYDLASLKFNHDPDLELLQVTDLNSLELIVYSTQGETNQSALAFAALEELLESGYVIQGEEVIKVAVYNPFTGTCSTSIAAEALNFKADKPLQINVEGTLATLHGQKSIVTETGDPVTMLCTSSYSEANENVLRMS